MSPTELMGRARNAAKDDAWGYFGEAGRFRAGATKDEEVERLEQVDAAVGAALLGLGVKEAEAIEFLRSRMGRHLGDAVLTVRTLADKSIAQHVKEHLGWYRKESGIRPKVKPARKPTLASIERIARLRLGIKTLEPRNSDRLDFHEVGVVCVRKALEDAYLAGFQAGGAR